MLFGRKGEIGSKEIDKLEKKLGTSPKDPVELRRQAIMFIFASGHLKEYQMKANAELLHRFLSMHTDSTVREQYAKLEGEVRQNEKLKRLLSEVDEKVQMHERELKKLH